MAKDSIRNVIRRLRFDHNEMTQQELADRVSVTRQTIIALESGKYGPSLSLAFRIARVFGVTVEEVFQYDGDVDQPIHIVLHSRKLSDCATHDSLRAAFKKEQQL